MVVCSYIDHASEAIWKEVLYSLFVNVGLVILIISIKLAGFLGPRFASFLFLSWGGGRRNPEIDIKKFFSTWQH